MEPQTTQIETTDATTTEFEVTLLAYYPYAQVVKVNAKDVDQAIDLAYENIDYTKFAPRGDTYGNPEVAVESVTPDDIFEDEDEDEGEEEAN